MDLADIYAKADAEVAALNPSCSNCVGGQCDGRCCRFKESGLHLRLTKVELDYMLSDNPPLQRPISPDACAFLDSAGRCSVYEKRPLACRVFYCDPKYLDGGKGEILNKFYSRFAVHTDAYVGIEEWLYGRELETNRVSLTTV